MDEERSGAAGDQALGPADNDGSREPTSRRSTERLVIVALVIVLGVAAAFMGLWLRDRSASAPEVTSFLQAKEGAVEEVSRKALDALMTYDAESLDARRDELDDLMSAKLLEEYEEILAGGLDEALEQRSASTEGTIVSGPDVAFISATQATATARVVQEVRHPDGEEGRTIFYAMRLILVEESGAWKVDRVDVLAQQ